MTVRFRRHDDLRLTALDEEGVVLHLADKRYYTVSATGLTILTALEQSATIDEVVTALVEEFDVSRDDARASAASFIEECLSSGLIIRDEPEP